MTGGIMLSTIAKTREQVLNDARGIIAETSRMSSSGVPTTLVPTSGRLHAGLVALYAGETITSLSVWMNGAGTSVTLFKLGLYDTSGNLLASTTDKSASLVANSINTFALSSSYSVTSTGAYYLALLGVNSSANPTLVIGTSSSSTQPGNQFGSGARLAVQQSSLADLPNPATFAASGAMFWMAAS